MSDSHNPTLQPPDAYRTQVNLRDVLAELLDEKLTAFKQELTAVMDEKLAVLKQELTGVIEEKQVQSQAQLDRMEREHRDFRQEMRRSISEMNRTWQEQSALHTRMSDNRLADVEHRLDTLEAKPA